MNEYYESLSKNFIKIDGKQTFYIFYNEKPKLGQKSFNIDKKMLEAALGGIDIEIHNIPQTGSSSTN